MRLKSRKANLKKLIYGLGNEFDKGKYRLLQMKEEIYPAALEIEKIKPKNIMEIGSHFGGSFRIWCTCCVGSGKKISLSWSQAEINYSLLDKMKIKRNILSCGKDVSYIDADSHLETTKKHVQSILKSEQLDFLFIDGDHSYARAKLDYEMYGSLVRKGGIIGFHDISGIKDVTRLWNEICINQKTRKSIEYAVPDIHSNGIGLLWKQ
jgi:cephalosporin hydroxylase